MNDMWVLCFCFWFLVFRVCLLVCFCLMNPRFGDEEGSNLEIPMCTDNINPAVPSQRTGKGAVWQDRELLHNNNLTPAKRHRKICGLTSTQSLVMMKPAPFPCLCISGGHMGSSNETNSYPFQPERYQWRFGGYRKLLPLPSPAPQVSMDAK